MMNSTLQRPAAGPGRKFIALAWLVLALGAPATALGQSAGFSFPQFNSSYVAGTEIPIQVTVTLAGKTVSKVNFSVQENFSGTFNPIGEDNTAPYSFNWTAPTVTQTARSFQIKAVVTFTDNSTVTANSGTGYVGVTVYRTTYVSTRNWYVSAAASASNTAGTEALPFNTIQKAADRVAPGDTVFVMAGTYTGTGVNIVQIQRTGFSNQWIVFMPYKTDKPKLAMGNNNWQAFNVLPAAAYVKIQGFEVVGNNANLNLTDAKAQPGACEGPSPAATPIAKFNGNGIAVTGRTGGNLRPHHVVFANNSVHDCAGAGFSAIEADYVTIEGNASFNNSWYTVYGTSGISVFNSWNFDTSTDVKMVVRNNVCYGNILKVAWNIGGTGTNCKFYDGNGIILDNNNAAKNPLGAYTGKTLVENNLCYLNGGRGLNVNYTDNATLLNNTTYRNGVSDGGLGIGIESEFIAQGSTGIRVFNNLFSGRPGEKTIEVNNSSIEHNHNLTFQDEGGKGSPYFTGNQNITGQNPQFVDAANGDFRLAGSSPALNKGSGTAGQYATTDLAGNARPLGAGVDIGAYELTGPAIAFSQQPGTGSGVCAGGSVTLSATVDGAVQSYQWFKGETAIDGATGASLVLSDVTANDGGSYKLVVSGFNVITSDPYVLTVNALPTPTVAAGGPTTFCQGGSVTLSTGTFSSYAWKNGSDQAGTKASYAATTGGTYSVTVTDANGCTGTSAPTTVVVNALPSVSLTGLAASYCQNASAFALTGQPAGGTFKVDGTVATQFNPSALSAGSHTVEYAYTDGNGCAGTANQPLEITEVAFTEAAAVAGAPLCAGRAVTLTFNVNCPANAAFTAELSNASGGFPGYTFPGTVAPGSPNSLTIPTGTVAGNGYKIRVVAANTAQSSTSPAFAVTAAGSVAVATPITPGKTCQGEALPVTFSTTGACAFPAGNGFTVQLSNAAGSFANPTDLGTAQVGTTNLALPANLPAGSGYRVRVVSSNPAQTSPASLPFKVEGPGLSTTPVVGGVPACPNGEVTVSFNLPDGGCAFPGGNGFTAQLSNAFGSFTNPTSLGSVVPGQSTPLTLPTNLPAGTGYRLRVVSSQPALVSSSSTPFRVNACNNREVHAETGGLRVSVSPNPVAEGRLKIAVDGAEGQALTVVLFNPTGQPVRSERVDQATGQDVLAWDIARQPRGLYLLRVSGARESKTLKVVH